MLLFGHHDSGHAYKVRLFLLMAELPHQFEWVDINLPRHERSEAFQNASAFGEVPVLVDEGRSWCQSNAILIHLAQKIQRFCGEPQEWSRLMEWLFWEPNRINFSVPNLRFAYRYVPQPPEVLAFLAARAQADLKTLDAHLSQQPFLLSSGFTIADISCASYLFWAEEARLNLTPYPHLRRWLHDIQKQPGWLPAYEALSRPAKS
jgi:glutathione S-transferase